MSQFPDKVRAKRKAPKDTRLEAEIESEIKDNLETMGFDVTKTSQRSRPIGITKGTPDLYVRSRRWQLRFWLEIKRPGKGPTFEQLGWHQSERECGGQVFVATSWSDVLAALRVLGVPIT